MEKETYSKGNQPEGYHSKAIQADIYPPRGGGQPSGYEAFGDMFQSYYYNPQSYLEGLKYHMKEHMAFGEQSAALQAIYGPQLRKVHPGPPGPPGKGPVHQQQHQHPGPHQGHVQQQGQGPGQGPMHGGHGHGPQGRAGAEVGRPGAGTGASLDLSGPAGGVRKEEPRKESDDECPSFQCLHSGASSSSSSPTVVQKPKLECFYCDFSHLQPVDPTRKKPKPERFLPCDKCDYFTALSSSLKSHMLKHSDERPLKCSYCDYATKHTSALKLHLSKHTGILQYACEQCSYRTASSSSLKSHLLKHTDVKHLKCPFCDYCTKHKNALKMHMCKHNGLLEHACPHCDYRSASSSCLKSHMLKHSDERPQKCAYCDYATKHKSALKNHLKKHATLPFCHVII